MFCVYLVMIFFVVYQLNILICSSIQSRISLIKQLHTVQPTESHNNSTTQEDICSSKPGLSAFDFQLLTFDFYFSRKARKAGNNFYNKDSNSLKLSPQRQILMDFVFHYSTLFILRANL